MFDDGMDIGRNRGEMSQARFATPNRSPASAHDSLYNKIAWRIMPIMFLGYIIAYLDRVNVGFAKLQMLGDLQIPVTAYMDSARASFSWDIFCSRFQATSFFTRWARASGFAACL